MKFTILSIVVVVICLENVSKAQIAKMKPLVLFRKADGHSKYPRVIGASQCGGTSELSEFRYQGCRPNDKVCIISVLEGLQGEIDLVPDRDMDALHLKIEVDVEDEDPFLLYDEPILNSDVKQGIKYTIQITTLIDDNLRGKNCKVRYFISDKADDSLRLCVAGQAFIV